MDKASNTSSELNLNSSIMDNRNKIRKNLPRIRSYRKNKKNKMYSMTNLIRTEVKKILEELSIPLNYLSQDEMDQLIEKCLKERVLFVNEEGNELPLTECDLKNGCILVKNIAIEMINNNDKDRVIVEYFQMLDKRVRSLEKVLTHLHKRLVKSRKEFVGYKINKDAIRSDIMEMLSSSNPDEAVDFLARSQQISKTRFYKKVEKNDDYNEKSEGKTEHKTVFSRRKENLEKLNQKTSKELINDIAKLLINQRNHYKNFKSLAKSFPSEPGKLSSKMAEKYPSNLESLSVRKFTQPPTFVYVEK